MPKYDPLKMKLNSEKGDLWTASFSEIEILLNDNLPHSAYIYREWWSNDRTHSQAQAWLAAGWKIQECDLERKLVTFRHEESGV